MASSACNGERFPLRAQLCLRRFPRRPFVLFCFFYLQELVRDVDRVEERLPLDGGLRLALDGAVFEVGVASGRFPSKTL